MVRREMNKTQSYVRLMRPVNCAMMGFAVIVGAALAGFNTLHSVWLELTLGFVTGFSLTGASMAINDYCDRKIDLVNEPDRPIPSGSVKPKAALVFACALTAIGFAASYFVNQSYLLALAVAVFAWAILMVYTTVGKRSGLPGNLLVSVCVAIPFVYGSVVTTSSVGLNVFFFALLVFLANTGREITKGIVDIQGDKAQGVKTLAVLYGENVASVGAAVFYVSAVLLSPIPWLLHVVSFWFIPFVAVTDFGLAAASFVLLRDHSREKARKVKNAVLLWFLIGLLAFAAGAA